MASAAAPLPVPAPAPPPRVELSVFGVDLGPEIGDFLARACAQDDEGADVVRLFRDGSAGADGPAGDVELADVGAAVATVADASRAGARRDRPRSVGEKEKVGPEKHSELVEIRADCQDCPWWSEARNAMATAKIHARAHEHQVAVQQTLKTTFERPHERDRQLPLNGGDRNA